MKSKERSTDSSIRASDTKNDGSNVIKGMSKTKSAGSSPIVLKSNGKSHVGSEASFAPELGRKGGAADSSVIPTKPHGKAVISAVDDDDLMVFSDVSLGPHEAQLRFRLIHLWEARNPHNRTLIGEEMLFIDEQFISST